VGAEIKLTVENDGGAARTIFRTIGEKSSFGSNPLEEHIGLGHGARIKSLETYWPATRTRQVFENVSTDQFIVVKEFDSSYTKLDRRPVQLGGAAVAGVQK